MQGMTVMVAVLVLQTRITPTEWIVMGFHTSLHMRLVLDYDIFGLLYDIPASCFLSFLISFISSDT